MKILFIDYSTGLQNLKTLYTMPRGGRLNSLLTIPDALSKLGHSCGVISDIKEGGITYAGVRWIVNNDSWRDYILGTKWDVLVCNRGIGKGYPEIRAKKRVLWTHDLPHNGFALEPKIFKAFDKVVFMSEYAERVWRTFYPIIGKSIIIPNGVSKLFKPQKKDMDYLIYISNPNRGLKRLPLIYEAIKSRTRDSVYMKAFSNAKLLHPTEKYGEDGYSLAYKECQDLGILHDPIPQHQLANELGKASLMILPTDYPEICSNAILQSLACGTPVVTTGRLGSAPQWIMHNWNGFLTRFHAEDYMVHTVEIVRGAVFILNNLKRHKKLIKNAVHTPGIYSWKTIGKKWSRMLWSL